MSYELDVQEFFDKVDEFVGRVENLPDVVSEYLADAGATNLKTNILPLINVSSANKKQHAALSQPFTVQQKERMTVDIIARGRWGYLVFPDEGRGQDAQEFMQHGADNAVPTITQELEQLLMESINE